MAYPGAGKAAVLGQTYAHGRHEAVRYGMLAATVRTEVADLLGRCPMQVSYAPGSAPRTVKDVLQRHRLCARVVGGEPAIVIFAHACLPESPGRC